MRQIINFNHNWLFLKGDMDFPRPPDKSPAYWRSKIERKIYGPAAYNYYDVRDPFYTGSVERRNDGWREVDIPHDFIVDQEYRKEFNNSHGYVEYFNGWYRKRFTVGEEARGKRVLLRFGGIATQSEIYLNGCLMKRNFSAYNSFEVDISNNVYFDKTNVLAVYANTDEFEGWWYQGGGIYRNVQLVITEPVAIDQYGVYAPAKQIGEKLWQIDFETTVVNDSYESADVVAETTVTDKNGHVLVTATGSGTVGLREKATLTYAAVVEDPLLWDTETPNLYQVHTVLKQNGEEIDEDDTRIGFRTVVMDPDKGLFLNGKHVKIKGVCGHQDFGVTGLAISDNVAKYKVQLLKEMGANGFRTSHYMHCEATMDALDEYGFLVMDETRWFETNEDAIAQLTTLVKRDRNRPGVIFWSTSNEEAAHQTDVGQRVHKALYQIIRKLDANRAIMVAQDQGMLRSKVYDDCDVIGVNYSPKDYDAIHAKWPHKPFVASECTATPHTRGADLGTTDARSASWDKDTDDNMISREKTWRLIASKDYIMGMFQWHGIEYRGEATWPMLCSKSGAIDLFLQKKGGFYQNQIYFTEGPKAYLVPHWNFYGLEGEPIPVKVYTNCDELELFVNGRSCGRKQIEKYGRGDWEVPYEPGTLSVKGYINGELAAEDERVTTKRPVRLRLTPMNTFTNNGEDVAVFVCEALDEDGRAVPDAAEFVHFDVVGEARYLGSGSDNCDHTTVTSHDRQMYMGKITVAVKPAAGAGEFRLYAKSERCGLAVSHQVFDK